MAIDLDPKENIKNRFRGDIDLALEICIRAIPKKI
jgi:hypothetical protein